MQFDTILGNDLLLHSRQDFEATALALYHYQYEHNTLYRSYNEALHIQPQQVQSMVQIPFLPISFFKSHQVRSNATLPIAKIFDSSGTTGMTPSKHHVHDIELYDAVALAGFKQFYHDPKDWVILALLPSYIERANSSLVHMVQMLMTETAQTVQGFYLNEFDLLQQQLQQLKASGKKVLLIGVTFALLDFAAAYPMDLQGVVVMETGGMKGRREEWTRAQVHQYLQQQWHLTHIHSEYGMTELLSQAYAPSEGLFNPIDTMRVLIRDIQDPLCTQLVGIGALNIIDLANVHSCAFIATEDMGKVNVNNSFEVMGRMDFAALRGCSLMAV